MSDPDRALRVALLVLVFALSLCALLVAYAAGTLAGAGPDGVPMPAPGPVVVAP